jgi:hypothetical protein
MHREADAQEQQRGLCDELERDTQALALAAADALVQRVAHDHAAHVQQAHVGQGLWCTHHMVCVCVWCVQRGVWWGVRRSQGSSSSSSSSQTAGRLQLWVRIVQPAADILLSIATP